MVIDARSHSEIHSSLSSDVVLVDWNMYLFKYT